MNAETAVCGFCQGNCTELVGAHTDHERWIPCTHCGGKGTGLTKEQADAREARVKRVRQYLVNAPDSSEVGIAHWLDLSLEQVREALAWVPFFERRDATLSDTNANPSLSGNR